MNEMRTGNVQTVGQLWARLHSQDLALTFDNFRVGVNNLISNGLLEVDEWHPLTFSEYLKSWSFGLRFWLFTIATISALAVTMFVHVGLPVLVVAWIAGTFLVLFAPGFALAWALFPSRQQLSGLNRLALTVSLSLFLVPAIGLIFNYTPIGIHARPSELAIVALTLVFLLVGAYREFMTT